LKDANGDDEFRIEEIFSFDRPHAPFESLVNCLMWGNFRGFQ